MGALVSGFLLGLGLILAIGAQNAFVLRQGLRGEHVFAVCLACALSDAVLIAAGVAGFGAGAAALPAIVPVLRIGGAAFVAVYGVRAFLRALGPAEALEPVPDTRPRLSAALATCLALTWLNPHVYLDTVVLVGSVSTQYRSPAVFAAGAVAASFAFFFALGYGAALLRPVFARPAAWRVLEAGIGVVMWAIAVGLLLG